MCIDVTLKEVFAVLHRQNDFETLYGFVVFEPQFEQYKLPTYQYLSEVKSSYKNADAKAAAEKRSFTISKSLGEITDELIIPAAQIFPTDRQVSEIFSI